MQAIALAQFWFPLSSRQQIYHFALDTILKIKIQLHHSGMIQDSAIHSGTVRNIQ